MRKPVQTRLIEPVDAKIERMLQGDGLRVLDLFAGCGGLALGFKWAGYDLVGAIEENDLDAETYRSNLHPKEPYNVLTKNLYTFKARDLAQEINTNGIDVIIGGPPCQKYMTLNRGAQRRANSGVDGESFKLIEIFLDYVAEIKPLVVLIENVIGLLELVDGNIVTLICTFLTELGYDAKFTVLDSVYYGVPQSRKRVFIVAYHNDFKTEFEPPNPTHYHDGRIGYKFTGEKLRKTENKWFKTPKKSIPSLPLSITVGQAIGDLPEDLSEFVEKPQSDYIKSLNNSTTPLKIFNHDYYPVTERDQFLISKMKDGDDFIDVYKIIIHDILHDKNVKIDKSNLWDLYELYSHFVPNVKYHTAWKRLFRDKPSPTIINLGEAQGSKHLLHYEYCRSLTVREAARLQSFPDSYVFSESKASGYRQVGNAVPPLLAYNLAKQIRMQIEAIELLTVVVD